MGWREINHSGEGKPTYVNAGHFPQEIFCATRMSITNTLHLHFDAKLNVGNISKCEEVL